MQILTNGREFLHAAPLATLATEPSAPRREVLTYGPIQDSVAPRHTTQWWGRFEKGETIEVEIQGGPTRGLELEVLDQDFHHIGQCRCGAGVTRFEVDVEREGVHYIRLRHAGQREGRFLLRVLQVRAARPAPLPRRVRAPLSKRLLHLFAPVTLRPQRETR